ncbi:MAG: amino acid ABC transporter permease [Lachnospiraceae bacterium]|nr:amino acid ABC transporter permease [Lachnospiraceae bacterium]
MWDIFTEYYIGAGLLWSGIGYTLLLSAIAVFFGAILGSLMAIGKRSRFAPLRFFITAVVEVLRGTPALLQLYVAYFIIPMLLKSAGMSPFACVAIALSLNSAAYVSEIIRSGIEAVDKGQTEAAQALGLTGKTAMLKIVLPQAVKNILPALGNEFITIIKETSLASTFYVGELMTTYQTIRGITFNTIPTLFIIGIVYFVMTFSLSKILKVFERRMKRSA